MNNNATVWADSRYSPLPVCPPLVDGESFTSWMNRIAARNQLPLSLVLARLTVAGGDLQRDMPTNYGLSLTDRQIDAVAAMTGATPAALKNSLIDRYHGESVDLSAYHEDPTRGVITIARSEWVHLSRSTYCPDCLRENGGAWLLHWRLPWSFVCPSHHNLLAALCPGCERAAGRERSDHATRPGFISAIPEPTLCRNSVDSRDAGFDVRSGAAAKPCGYDLIDTVSTHVGDLSAVTSAQQSLNNLLATSGHRNTWKDLRALTATLMYFTDTGTLTNLAPQLTEHMFASPTLVDAVTRIEDDRRARAQVQQRVRDGGGDHRTGTRQRYGTATPTDPALMAVLATIALHLYGESSQHGDHHTDSARLHDLARLARSQGKKLHQMLAASGATPALVGAAQDAARATTGRFADAATDTSSGAVDPSAIPTYLWETEAEPFIACLPGTREETARMFASMTIVKSLTGDSWADVTTRLGLPSNKVPLTSDLVYRLTCAGTQADFHAAAQTIIARIANGDIPTYDYADRRHRLRMLKKVPAYVLKEADPTLIATSARRVYAAVWLWAQLTGGDPWDAPAWGVDAPANRKLLYRRFVSRDLNRLRPALLAYGETLLHGTAGDST